MAREVGGYRIVSLLGAGGMGRVHLARSASGRLVAVKTVHRHLAADETFRERFRREVRAARAVRGPYTAAVLDADCDAEEPWLAAEFCPGPTLGEVVEAQGPLGGADAASLGAALAEALAAVHGAGLAHRDLKPANVVVTVDGPVVVDFGVARAFARDGTRDGAGDGIEAGAGIEAGDTLTGSGDIVGSPGFIAPELLERDGSAGPAADLFALGCVLAYALTGRPPFGTGPAHRVLYRTLHADPDLGGCPGPEPQWPRFLRRVLAHDPARRPSVAEVLAWCADRAPERPWWRHPEVRLLIGRYEAEADAAVARTAPRRAPGTAPPQGPRISPPQTPETAGGRRGPGPGPGRRRLLAGAGGAALAAAAGWAAARGLRGGGDGADGGKGGGATGTAAARGGPAAGRVLWSRPVGEREEGCALLRHRGAVYLLDDRELTRMAPSTGHVEWRVGSGGAVAVAAAGDALHTVRPGTGTAGPLLVTYRATTGGVVREVQWPEWLIPVPGQLDVFTGAVFGGQLARVVATDRVVCAVTYQAAASRLARRQPAQARPWRLYAFDPHSGRPRWYDVGTMAEVDGLYAAGGHIGVVTYTQPRVDAAGNVSGDAEGLLTVRDEDGGGRATPAPGAPDPASRRSARAAAGGALHHTRGRTVVAHHPATRATLWERRVAADGEGELTVTAAAAGGLVHAASGSDLYGLDAADGAVRWHRPGLRAIGAPRTPPEVAAGLVYAAGPEPGAAESPLPGVARGVYALDAATGEPVWAAPLDLRSSPAAVAAGGGVLHVAAGGTLTALTGPERGRGGRAGHGRHGRHGRHSGRERA